MVSPSPPIVSSSPPPTVTSPPSATSPGKWVMEMKWRRERGGVEDKGHQLNYRPRKLKPVNEYFFRSKILCTNNATQESIFKFPWLVQVWDYSIKLSVFLSLLNEFSRWWWMNSRTVEQDVEITLQNTHAFTWFSQGTTYIYGRIM